MNIRANFGVHFHDQDHASVELTINGVEDERNTEVLLFCLFALRQLVNLGRSEPALRLAGFLSDAGANINEFIQHQSSDAPRLVEWKGVQGEKRFVATLTRTDDHFNFQMNQKGFGFFNRGIGYYAPHSVLLLLKHLGKRRSEDQRYVRLLGNAAVGCATAFRDGQCTITTQYHIALIAVSILACATKDVNIEDVLRQAGAKLTPQDFAEAFKSVQSPNVLDFNNLDQATRLVCLQFAKEQMEIIRPACPPFALPQDDELLVQISLALLDGYIYARWLLGTHTTRLAFSKDESHVQANAYLMSKEAERLKPVDLLNTAGEHLTDAFESWAENLSQEGIYTKVPDRELAIKLRLCTMLIGFGLAVAEYKIATERSR